MHKIRINTDEIKLDQFLKWSNIVSSGGEAKTIIREGEVKVNGEIEFKRSHKLKPGDIIEVSFIEEKYHLLKALKEG
jgi:ribosome-associated protein